MASANSSCAPSSSSSSWHRDLSETVNDLTVCSICLDTMKTPKYFSCCLHTFCLLCIQSYLDNAFKDHIPRTVTCPVCRAKMKVPDNIRNAEDFAKKLPFNHIIMSLIDAQKMQKGKSYCGPCKKLDGNKETNAKVYCVECREAFCDECSKYHKAFKAFVDHELIDIDKVSDLHLKLGSQYSTCSEHMKKIELYCKDHQKPCCLHCVTLEHRKCNEVEAIDEAAKKLRDGDSYLHLLNTFGMLNRSFEKATDARDQLLCASQAEECSGKGKIKEVRKSIEEQLAKLEQKCLDRFAFSCGENLAKLSKDMETFEEKRKMVIHCQNMLKAGLQCNSDVQLLYDYNNMKSQKEELENFLMENVEVKYTKVKFEVDEAVENITSQLSALGKIVATEESESCVCKTLLETNVEPRNDLDLQTALSGGSKFSGVTIHDDYILLVEYHRCRLYIFFDVTEDGYYGKVKLKQTISSSDKSLCPWDVAGTLPGRCVVSFPKNKLLADVCLNSRAVTRWIQINSPQSGLSFYSNTIVSSQRAENSTGKDLICVYGLNGNLIREFKAVRPNYIHVDDIGRIMFSNRNSDSLMCMTYDFQPVFEYSHENLKGVSGITTDTEGNIYVAGFNSNNIHQLTPEGKLNRIILSDANEISSPRGIAYKKDIDILVVLNDCGCKIAMFSLHDYYY